MANLRVVEGVATRKFEPQDEVLSYFGYADSPFYAVLPEEDQEDQTVSVPTGDASTVRYLQHRMAMPPTSAERDADEGRIEFLRELYEEASKVERSRGGRRGGGWFGSFVGG